MERTIGHSLHGALALCVLLFARGSFESARGEESGANPAKQPGPPVFDRKALETVPRQFPASGHELPGVRAFFYEGEPYRGKPTRVFAYYGAPKREPEKKLPAMVLVHGGGGTAFDRWVRLWNDRGYAALAMDLCGCVPVGTYGQWKRHDEGGPPGWHPCFEQVNEPAVDQWPYHAVTAILRGHTLLRSMPEIDADRIGLTGISWGGYLTCLVAGVDDRFRFAAPVYGCGYLGENSAWLPNFEQMGKDKSERWLAQWDPAHYLPQAKRPMLWVNGTNDFAYPMDSWQKSYRLPKGMRTLCLRVRMPHGHGAAGENPEEIHAFANSLLKEGQPLARIVRQERKGENVWAEYESPRAVEKAELNFTRDRGKWQDRNWESIPADLDHKAKRVSAKLPSGVAVYYFNLFDDAGHAVSTEHESLSPPE